MSSLFALCPSGEYNICKLCSGKIKVRPDGGSSDMNRHIKYKHPDQMSKSPKSTFADRERELDAFFNKQANPSEVNGYATSSFGKPPADSVFAESDLNPSFHNHGTLSEDGMSSCSRVQGEHSGSETLDIGNEILRCVTMLLGDMKNIKKEVDVLKRNKDKEKAEKVADCYKPKIKTVKGFTFEDYP